MAQTDNDAKRHLLLQGLLLWEAEALPLAPHVCHPRAPTPRSAQPADASSRQFKSWCIAYPAVSAAFHTIASSRPQTGRNELGGLPRRVRT